MMFYQVSVSSSSGNLGSLLEITESQYTQLKDNPYVFFDLIVFGITAKNPKDAQRKASKTYQKVRNNLFNGK